MNVVQSTPQELADSAIQIVDILVPSHQEGNVAVIQRMPQEGTHDCFAELVVPVPQVREEIAAASHPVPPAEHNVDVPNPVSWTLWRREAAHFTPQEPEDVA